MSNAEAGGVPATGMSAVLSKARIVTISLGKSLAGRPPCEPRAQVAFRPTTVGLPGGLKFVLEPVLLLLYVALVLWATSRQIDYARTSCRSEHLSVLSGE